MCLLALTKFSFGSPILVLLHIASNIGAVECFDADKYSCATSDTGLCQSGPFDDGSVNVPSLLQKVQGAPRVQVAAPEDFVDDDSLEVRIVLPKRGHHSRESRSDSKPTVVAMVEVVEDPKSESAEPKVISLVQNSTLSNEHTVSQKTVLAAENLTDSKTSSASLGNSTGKGTPKAGSQMQTSRIPKPSSTHLKQSSSDSHVAPGHHPHKDDVATVASKNQRSSPGASAEELIDFMQENSSNKLEDVKVDNRSHHRHSGHHHGHFQHLFLPNGTSRHQMALALRHLLEGYLDSAKKHPFLSPLLASRLNTQKPHSSVHGVAEHASTPGASKLDQPLLEDDGTATTTLYLGCVLMSFCLLLWMLCLSYWPTAGEHVDAALSMGPAVLVGKRAPDFTMTMLDGSTKRLRDITQEGKPVVVKFYNNDDDGKSLLRQSKFSQDVKGLEQMARDVKYAGHANFVLVNLQGRGAAVEYHNSLKLSGAFQSTFAGAAILHGGLNGAWCDLSQDYHTSYCPHTAVIDSQGIVVRNYNHMRWWTEGSVVGEDFAALSQTVDDLMKVSCNPGAMIS